MLCFLDKMFHIKVAVWRLVHYVILEGRSPDRIQSIKKGPQRCGPFLYVNCYCPKFSEKGHFFGISLKEIVA